MIITRFYLCLAFSCLASLLCASDTLYVIRVHCLYGSKPKKEFKASERNWFGGKWGGHVGIGFDSARVIDFVPSGEFHVFAKKKERHSAFTIRSEYSFWSIFGGTPETVKRISFIIPLTVEQKIKFDSIKQAYTTTTPYDYAFVGMRCAAASYDILAQLELVKEYSYRKTYRKIFYPRRIRKRLFRKAEEQGWTIERQEGVNTRKWDHD